MRVGSDGAGSRAGRRLLALPFCLGAALLVLVAAWCVVERPALWEGARWAFGSPEILEEYVSGLGAWAPVIFFLAHTAQVIAAPIPGGATTVAGPLLFGPWFGTALVLAGGMVGSVVLFALVRRWGPPLAARLVGRKNFRRFSGVFDDERGAVLLVVMLVPFVPDDVAVAAAALSRVSFGRFVVLVALGRLPGWALTALVAADLVGRSAGTLATVGLAALVAAALVFAYRKRLEAWLLRRAGARQKEDRRTSHEHPIP